MPDIKTLIQNIKIKKCITKNIFYSFYIKRIFYNKSGF